MLDEKKDLSNRINNILPEHIFWIKTQMMKKNGFIKTRGREVLIDDSYKNSVHIVNIPSKDQIGYLASWIDVYNYALDYLEGAINKACEENKFIKMENGVYKLNDRPIRWPLFKACDASYAKGLEKILNEYNDAKRKLKESDNVFVKKSSVVLKTSDDISISDDSIDYAIKKINEDKKEKKVSNFENLKRRIRSVIHNNENEIDINKTDKFIIQKLSDGDIIDSRDINNLKNNKTDIAFITCQDIDIPKEENVFLSNMELCQREGLNTGAFIYGNSADQHSAAIELRRINKLLLKCNISSKLVIYNINNDYVIKNKNSELKVLEYINIYNSILLSLRKKGYYVMLSMNVESSKVINDINKRYNIQNDYEVVYMTVVRDLENIDSNSSVIIVDPANNYDEVEIKNKKILNELKNIISVKEKA